MSLVADILNHLGVPYPDADVDKIREAATQWSTLADAVGDATATAGSQAQALIECDHGPAMDRFSQMWNQLGGGRKGLTALADACRGMSTNCTNYADAVEHARHKIEETLVSAGVMGGGAIFLTAATFGLSDALADGAADALADTCMQDIEILGSTIDEIIGRMGAGFVVNALDSLLGSAASNAVAVTTGDKPGSLGEELLGAANSGLVGAAASGAAPIAGEGIARLAESDKTWDVLPGDIDKILPQLPTALAATPGAIDTPAGQTILNILSQGAIGEVDPSGGPSTTSIIGDVLSSRLEVALDQEPGADPKIDRDKKK